MALNPLRWIYRAWLHAELKHIDDAIADELDRQRRHEATLRNWQRLRADIAWKLRPTTINRGLAAWPKERT